LQHKNSKSKDLVDSDQNMVSELSTLDILTSEYGL
jgi:hypothetical protein